MPNFHAIAVRRDGAIAHSPTNYHTESIRLAGWRENDQMADYRGPFFVECRWFPAGQFPGAEAVIVDRQSDINERQRRSIENHYRNLEKLFDDPGKHGDRMCFDGGYFSDVEKYGDVRWELLVHSRCPNSLANRLSNTPLYPTNGPILCTLHPGVRVLEYGFGVAEGCSITAPALTEVAGGFQSKRGNILVKAHASLSAPLLRSAGTLNICCGATVVMHNLTHLHAVRIQVGGIFEAPMLGEIEDLILDGETSFAAHSLSKAAFIRAGKGATMHAPNLLTAGALEVESGGTLIAPKLSRISYLENGSGATIVAPMLERFAPS